MGLFCDRNYNGGRNRKKPVSREVAMEELLQVVKAFQISLQNQMPCENLDSVSKFQTKTSFLQIKSTKPDKFTPRIMEKKDDYVRVEYQSSILGVKSSDSLVWVMWSINMVLVLFDTYGISRIRAVCWWCWVLVSTGQRFDSGVPICIPVRELWFWHKQEENQGEHCNQPHISVLLSLH